MTLKQSKVCCVSLTLFKINESYINISVSLAFVDHILCIFSLQNQLAAPNCTLASLSSHLIPNTSNNLYLRNNSTESQTSQCASYLECENFNKLDASRYDIYHDLNNSNASSNLDSADASLNDSWSAIGNSWSSYQCTKYVPYDSTSLPNGRFSVAFIDTHCHLDFLFSKVGHVGTLGNYKIKMAAKNVELLKFPASYEGCVAIFCQPNTFHRVSICMRL